MKLDHKTYKYVKKVSEIMRNGNRRENIKVIILTEKDRKLLEGINKSLEDIKKGRIKPFLKKEIMKRT